MDTAKTGSLSSETPWVSEEYFANRYRNQQSFLPSTTTTSWCSRMRHSNPRRRGPVLKYNAEDHRPTTNEVLARFGVTKVGLRTPFILVQSAALERVPPPKRSPASCLRLDHIQSKNFLDFCDSSGQSSGSSKSNERDTSEGETLAMAEAKTREDLFNHSQSYIENDFDRLEPCYDWYLSREQELNTNLETRSAHAAMGLGSSSLRYPPGNTGGFLSRPGTAPEMKMTRSDRSTTGEWLVIRKLKLLQRKTDSLTPSRFQHKVVDDKNLLDSISGRDEDGLGVQSEEVASEEALSWTTRHGVKGTTGSEDTGLLSAERQRPGSRNSQYRTPSPRDKRGSEHGVVNVDHQDPRIQKDSAVLRIASGLTERNLEEQSNVSGPIWHVGDANEIDDSVSDKEMSISSGYRLPATTDGNHDPTGDHPAGDKPTTQLENGSGRSPENSDETDINAREMLQTMRPSPVAATASIQRPKTARRKMSSSATRHRCLRKEATEKQKMTDSEQPIQQKTTTKDKEPQRRESRRKRHSRNRQTLISHDADSLVATAVNDSSLITESLIEQFSSSCRETPWPSKDNPSADSKLINCGVEKKSETTPQSDSLSLRRRNLVDAALQRNLSFVKSSRSELVGDIEGGEGLAINKAFQVMDSHKIDLEVGERDGRRKDYHKSKQNGRIAFSQRSCRFELPMDMKQFEKLSPQEYLRKYCRISPRRQILYKRIFLKYVPMIGWFPRKDLLKLLTELFGEAACASDVAYICDLLQITDETRIDLELFSATAAVTERLLYPQFVTQHTRHIQDYKKEEIEKADFSALLTKLSGIHVRPEMKKLVDAIK